MAHRVGMVTDMTTRPVPDLTIHEVADELAVAQRTVWREIHAGRLHAYKVGAVWRVTRAALDAYKAEHTAHTAPPIKRGPGRPRKQA